MNTVYDLKKEKTESDSYFNNIYTKLLSYKNIIEDSEPKTYYFSLKSIKESIKADNSNHFDQEDYREDYAVKSLSNPYALWEQYLKECTSLKATWIILHKIEDFFLNELNLHIVDNPFFKKDFKYFLLSLFQEIDMSEKQAWIYFYYYINNINNNIHKHQKIMEELTKIQKDFVNSYMEGTSYYKIPLILLQKESLYKTEINAIDNPY